MTDCLNCGGGVARPYECSYCEGKYCSECRLPETHNCPGARGEGTESEGQTITGLTGLFTDLTESDSDSDRATSSTRRGVVGLFVTAVGVGGAGAVFGNISIPDLDAQQQTTESTAKQSPTANPSESDGGGLFADEWDAAATADIVHDQINTARSDHGVGPLSFDQGLASIASQYATRMAEEGFFSHTDPSGDGFEARYKAAGYDCQITVSADSYVTGGENIAQTYWQTDVETKDGVEYYGTPQELADGIVNGWLASDGHRQNLLKPYWRNEGIGVARDSNNRVFAVQNFC